MPEFISLFDLKDHVGKQVHLCGWVYNLRSSGKVCFIVLRDGTNLCQCVLSFSEDTQKIFEIFEELTQESLVEIEGLVKKWKNDFEIEVLNLKLLSKADAYPISKKDHGVDFLMNHRHLWLRSKRPQAILRIRHFVIEACHLFFGNKKFIQVDPPILTPVACEGTSTLFEVKTTALDSVYLSQSGQMYLEAAAAAFNKVFCLSPTFRAEKSSTRRHLMEFWMCEAEMAFCDLNQNMDIIEELIFFIVKHVLEKANRELEILKRDISLLKKIQTPFPRIHYDEACRHLAQKSSSFKKGEDFGGNDETILGSLYDRPLFIHHYPRNIKAFYMKAEGVSSLSCDLIAPEGYGEIVGGGQREDDLKTLQASIKEHSLDEKDLKWYLDLRRYGTFKHGGFGMGLERLICWICGTDHIRESSAFPRLYGRKFFEKAT